MATIKNSIDIALQASTTRILSTDISFSAGGYSFSSTSGVIAPASIQIIATAAGFTSAHSTAWEYRLSTSGTWDTLTSAQGTVSGAQGDTLTVTSAQYLATISTAAFVTYRATSTQYSYSPAVGEYTIYYNIVGTSYTLSILNGIRAITYLADGSSPSPVMTAFSCSLYQNSSVVTPATYAWSATGVLSGTSSSPTFTPTVSSYSITTTTTVSLTITYAVGVSLTQTIPITITKPGVAGTNGSNGINGTNGIDGSDGLNGTRGIAFKTGTNTAHATANALTSAGNAVIASYMGLAPYQVGDTIALTNSVSATPWSAQWLCTTAGNPGVWAPVSLYIDGNAVITGTLSAGKIGTGSINAANIDTTGYIRSSGIGPSTTIQALGGTATGTAGAILNSSTSSTNKIGLVGLSYTTDIGVGVYGEATGGTANTVGVFGYGFYGTIGRSLSTNGVGLVGQGQGSTSTGVRGEGTSYNFYANGPGTDYGTFTGFHEVLIPINTEYTLGDIVIDNECLVYKKISNTLFNVTVSNSYKQKAAIGVIALDMGLLSNNKPNSLMEGYFTGEDVSSELYEQIKNDYTLLAVNALGEGLMNVCGQGGSITAGDFICTSDILGKGMKQDDDLIHNYTVARARENCNFSNTSEVKMIACIYMCG